MIEARELYKQYAGNHALNGLSFRAEPGAVLGFIGPNGAGKSTAMRIVCGIMPPTSGEVFISGVDMLSEPERAKRRLGYLPENAPLYPGMNVISFLRFCGKMRGLSGKALDSAIGEACGRCRLGDVLHEDTEALSKGYRRRVCLAQSILHKPENLVLDEPTDGLDPDQKREIRALIRELGTTAAIVVSTHILEEIDEVCGRVLAVRRGKKVFDGTTLEFKHLSPDSGTVVLTLPEASEELDSAFGKLPGTLRLEAVRSEGKSVLRITPEEGGSPAFAAAAANLAASQRRAVLSLEVLTADLGRIFASLGNDGDRT